MEGLEVSIVPFAEWKKDNRFLRLDSEYQLKRDRDAIDRVRAFGANQLKEDDPKIIHPQEIVRQYVDDDGVWFLRAQNVRPLRIDTGNRVHISKEDAKKLSRNKIVQDDVLITRTGANRGQCALYDLDDIAIASSHTFIVRTKKIDPSFLAVYLNTSYGVSQISKGVYGAAQPEVAPYYLRNIWIPEISNSLLNLVKRSFHRSKEARSDAVQQMQLAQATVLSELGLVGWSPAEPLNYAARASDVLSAGRLDAQYFRPLFEEVEERLEATGGAVALADILTVNARGRQPHYDDTGLPVVNSKHVRTNRVILDENRTATEAGSPIQICTGDVLVNGTGVGTIGRTAVYLHDEPALPDNHVTVLRTEQIDPVFLSVFLNSPLGQWQIERHIKGSSGQIELYPNDIARISVWDAPDDIQQSIRNSVLSAFAAERRADSLLDVAKRILEIAIEDGETAALAWLDNHEEEEV